MKLIIGLAFLTFTLSAVADPNCQKLSSFVGEYKLVAQTCIGFGDQLEVKSFSSNKIEGFAFLSNGINIFEVTTSDLSDDLCTLNGETLTATVCASGVPCFPKNWVYTFTGDKATFTAEDCKAEYVKVIE